VRLTAGQVDQLVVGAVATGRIPAGRAGYWRGRVMAAGQDGAEAIAALMSLAPVLASAPLDIGGEEDALYARLYPVAAAGLGRLDLDDADRHEVVTHPAVSVTHSHEHASYEGGGATHSHPHVHRADARHDPGAGHPHVVEGPPFAGSGRDVAAARRAEGLAADPGGPAGWTLDQLYEALWGRE
jgi:hypothetical protein